MNNEGSNDIMDANGNVIEFIGSIFNGMNFRYRILSELGSGSFGIVFSAEVLDSDIYNNNVAIKCFNSRDEYENEAYSYKLIDLYITNSDRNYFLNVLDYSGVDDVHFIVFEKVGNCLLTDIAESGYRCIYQHSIYDIKFIRKVMSGMLNALNALHRLGLCHLDVKPENICRAHDFGDWKLIDLGSVEREEEGIKELRTSPYYRAPEIALLAKICMKSDIWSVGCVGFELFHGLPLFPYEENCDLIYHMARLFGPIPKYLLSMTTLSTIDNVLNEDGTASPLYFSRLKHCVVNFMSEFEIPLSDEGMKRDVDYFCDLLKKMLQLDPDTRITAEDALRHPFFSIG